MPQNLKQRNLGKRRLPLLALWCLAMIPLCSSAANSPLQSGVHYYLIENLSDSAETGGSVLRGKAGSQGYAHDAIILAPNTLYREWILHLQTMRVAVTNYTTPDVGRSFRLPEFQLRTSTSPDSDGDGLHDLAEFILGTLPNRADTDG